MTEKNTGKKISGNAVADKSTEGKHGQRRTQTNDRLPSAGRAEPSEGNGSTKDTSATVTSIGNESIASTMNGTKRSEQTKSPAVRQIQSGRRASLSGDEMSRFLTGNKRADRSDGDQIGFDGSNQSFVGWQPKQRRRAEDFRREKSVQTEYPYSSIERQFAGLGHREIENCFIEMVDNVKASLVSLDATMSHLLWVKDEAQQFKMPSNLLLRLAVVSSSMTRSKNELTGPLLRLLEAVLIYSQPWERLHLRYDKIEKELERKKRELDRSLQKLAAEEGFSTYIKASRVEDRWKRMVEKMTFAETQTTRVSAMRDYLNTLKTELQNLRKRYKKSEKQNRKYQAKVAAARGSGISNSSAAMQVLNDLPKGGSALSSKDIANAAIAVTEAMETDIQIVSSKSRSSVESSLPVAGLVSDIDSAAATVSTSVEREKARRRAAKTGEVTTTPISRTGEKMAENAVSLWSSTMAKSKSGVMEPLNLSKGGNPNEDHLNRASLDTNFHAVFGGVGIAALNEDPGAMEYIAKAYENGEHGALPNQYLALAWYKSLAVVRENVARIQKDVSDAQLSAALESASEQRIALREQIMNEIHEKEAKEKKEKEKEEGQISDSSEESEEDKVVEKKRKSNRVKSVGFTVADSDDITTIPPPKLRRHKSMAADVAVKNYSKRGNVIQSSASIERKKVPPIQRGVSTLALSKANKAKSTDQVKKQSDGTKLAGEISRRATEEVQRKAVETKLTRKSKESLVKQRQLEQQLEEYKQKVAKMEEEERRKREIMSTIEKRQKMYQKKKQEKQKEIGKKNKPISETKEEKSEARVEVGVEEEKETEEEVPVPTEPGTFIEQEESGGPIMESGKEGEEEKHTETASYGEYDGEKPIKEEEREEGEEEEEGDASLTESDTKSVEEDGGSLEEKYSLQFEIQNSEKALLLANLKRITAELDAQKTLNKELQEDHSLTDIDIEGTESLSIIQKSDEETNVEVNGDVSGGEVSGKKENKRVTEFNVGKIPEFSKKKKPAEDTTNIQAKKDDSSDKEEPQKPASITRQSDDMYYTGQSYQEIMVSLNGAMTESVKPHVGLQEEVEKKEEVVEKEEKEATPKPSVFKFSSDSPSSTFTTATQAKGSSISMKRRTQPKGSDPYAVIHDTSRLHVRPNKIRDEVEGSDKLENDTKADGEATDLAGAHKAKLAESEFLHQRRATAPFTQSRSEQTSIQQEIIIPAVFLPHVSVKARATTFSSRAHNYLNPVNSSNRMSQPPSIFALPGLPGYSLRDEKRSPRRKTNRKTAPKSVIDFTANADQSHV